ncbi:uracil-DNA glycosylase [Microbacterium sp. NPDC028030]|uniref:uracil-DNA glycosylase n=1 Tax=Microbacterium sp. NPDC028030 TaxID=3155124 RepID=UPI00340B2061
MSAVIGFGGFFLSLWLSYQVFPFHSSEPGSVPAGRFLIIGVGTTIAIVIANRLNNRSTVDEIPNNHETVALGSPSIAQLPNSHLLPDDWSRAFEVAGFSTKLIDSVLTRVYTGGRATLPDRRQVFRAFELTPLRDVKVVIVGQDPYYTVDQADGLAFSVGPGMTPPHSLRRVFDSLEKDSRVHFSRPAHGGDLTAWARRGVLLLNTSLTVKENSPGSDSDPWREFTRTALEIVGAKTDPVVFMLWGDPANDLADRVHLPAHHLILRSTHPRQEVASRFPRFADARHFSEANDFLRSAGRPAVDWAL